MALHFHSGQDQEKKKKTRTVTVEVIDDEDSAVLAQEIVQAPSEENAGMPSISLTPPDLTTPNRESDGDASDEA